MSQHSTTATKNPWFTDLYHLLAKTPSHLLFPAKPHVSACVSCLLLLSNLASPSFVPATVVYISNSLSTGCVRLDRQINDALGRKRKHDEVQKPPASTPPTKQVKITSNQVNTRFSSSQHQSTNPNRTGTMRDGATGSRAKAKSRKRAARGNGSVFFI